MRRRIALQAAEAGVLQYRPQGRCPGQQETQHRLLVLAQLRQRDQAMHRLHRQPLRPRYHDHQGLFRHVPRDEPVADRVVQHRETGEGCDHRRDLERRLPQPVDDGGRDLVRDPVLAAEHDEVVLERHRRHDPGRPVLVERRWPGLPGDLGAPDHQLILHMQAACHARTINETRSFFNQIIVNSRPLALPGSRPAGTLDAAWPDDPEIGMIPRAGSNAAQVWAAWMKPMASLLARWQP